MKNQYIDEKKLQKNGIDNQCSYKKLCEKDEKKFGRTKKVRTFALANEARDTRLARNCESYLKLRVSVSSQKNNNKLYNEEFDPGSG